MEKAPSYYQINMDEYLLAVSPLSNMIINDLRIIIYLEKNLKFLLKEFQFVMPLMALQ